jgi:hypothetical protein
MIENEIRKQLASYVLREIPLESFEDWFVSASWNACNSPNADVRVLVYAVESVLAEYSGGYISESALRARLLGLADRYSVNVAMGAPDSAMQVQTGSSQSVTPVYEYQIRAVDIQPSMAFA